MYPNIFFWNFLKKHFIYSVLNDGEFLLGMDKTFENNQESY